MKRTAALVVAIAMALAFAAPAAATTTRTSYACDAYLVEVTNEGTYWIDDGALHMRGWSAIYDMVGDDMCAGTLFGGANFNLDLATSSGIVWGTGRIELEAVEGGFDSTLVAHFTADNPLLPDATDIWLARYVRKGFGELAGWQARGTLLERTHDHMVDTGYAFLPGD